ncbi:MAG: ArsR family transcriptional regulator [Proteobacteria bacterium]|nr:ArsR family transcriptional regulator [Pseudomonadota bacterium]
MKQFMHPSIDDITLSGVLGALSDPIRLKIFVSLIDKKSCMSCTEASPLKNIAKSTLSHHFRILREAGLIRTTKLGVENRNIARIEEVNERFPGLLKHIVKLAKEHPARL